MKVLLLDADGVVLVKGEYFSAKYAREHGVSVDDLMEFFRGPYIECQRGEIDVKEVLPPYLEKWGWQGSTDDFLEYWFASDIVPNIEIRESLLALRAKGVKVYLASNNEKYRAAEIERVLTELNLLDGFYFSPDLKARKEDVRFFQYVLNDLEVSPSEVVFIDNDQKNVDSAATVGISALLYHPGIIEELVEKSNQT